jgi:dolichyl-phosphate beta-glucosyltransferase
MTIPVASGGHELLLTVVLPIYNEDLVLQRNLGAILDWLTRSRMGDGDFWFEVVAVDDGSIDASPDVLREAARRDPRIRVLTLRPNRGKGAAVRAGMLASKGAYVVFMDADLSTPLEEIPGLLRALDGGADAVFGTRRAPGASIERGQPWMRRTLGKGFTLLTRVLLRSDCNDFTCGFKGFRREAVVKIFSRSRLNRWAFDAEIVAILAVLKLCVVYVPVRWRHEDDTKVRLFGAVVRSFLELLSIVWRRAMGAYK